MSSKKGNKKHNKATGGYYKKEIVSVEPQENNKFEVSSDEDEEDQLPNFNYLASLPISAQSHLILKSEQEKFQGESIVSYSKYFNIDVNLLNLASRSIPFNELHHISGIEWSEEECDHMREVARSYEEQYKELLTNSTGVSKVPQATPDTLAKKTEKLNISPTATITANQSEEVAESGSKASMEKWLDGILDI